MKAEYKALLDNIKEVEEVIPTDENFHSRVLVIDALNLFFRNFATINMTNQDGAHTKEWSAILGGGDFTIVEEAYEDVIPHYFQDEPE